MSTSSRYSPQHARRNRLVPDVAIARNACAGREVVQLARLERVEVKAFLQNQLSSRGPLRPMPPYTLFLSLRPEAFWPARRDAMDRPALTPLTLQAVLQPGQQPFQLFSQAASCNTIGGAGGPNRL